MLTKEAIDINRDRIISLLHSTGREGMNRVIEYLDGNDFFSMPSSLQRHHNWDGGLAQHCIGVYERLKKTGEDLPSDSVIITSFLHDICKARKIYKSKEGEWKMRSEEDLHIPGHGSRSVKLLEKLGLSLTPEERSAIRWHMGGWKLNEKSKGDIRDFHANKKNDLWRLLYNADRYDASHHPSTNQTAIKKGHV